MEHYNDAAARPAVEGGATIARRPRVATPVGESTTVTFAPKVGARRLTGMVLLSALVAAGWAGYRAYGDPSTLSVGVTVTLGALVLVVWAIRAASPLTLMAVRGGLLEVRRGGLHLKFDLSSHYTPIEVQGTPGRRGWRVLFGRGTMPAFIVDSSVVDAEAFMEVLRRYRPE